MSTYELKKSLLKRAFAQNRGAEVIMEIQVRLKKIHQMAADDKINYNQLWCDTRPETREVRTKRLLQVMERAQTAEPVIHAPRPVTGGLFGRHLN